MGTFARKSQFKYSQLRLPNGLVRSSKQCVRVLIACTFIACASSVKCELVAKIRRLHMQHDLLSPRRPTNGPTGDPSMVRLP